MRKERFGKVKIRHYPLSHLNRNVSGNRSCSRVWQSLKENKGSINVLISPWWNLLHVKLQGLMLSCKLLDKTEVSATKFCQSCFQKRAQTGQVSGLHWQWEGTGGCWSRLCASVLQFYGLCCCSPGRRQGNDSSLLRTHSVRVWDCFLLNHKRTSCFLWPPSAFCLLGDWQI